LADLCRISLWYWEIRSVGAYGSAASNSVSVNLPSASLALATLTGITLQENIRNLLVDQVIKAVRERR
jgi:hypothetical protein